MSTRRRTPRRRIIAAVLTALVVPVAGPASALAVPAHVKVGDTPAESVAFGPMMHPSPSSIDDSPNNAPTGKQIALRWPKRANRCARQ